MPTFDFHCTSCDQTFECKRPFGSHAIPQCPSCSSRKTEKQIAPPVIQFKGSGFYKTDSIKSTQPAEQKKPNEPNKPKDPPTPKKQDVKEK